ncbi:hypothetical protein COLO4_24416 [Corchorus olitorius]|uniref:Uncharacterized protein n=1 Tax=Corchorus olitorius TaxID=93759 RepID=A0A1R3IA79_9ROSI|nr:hypothetical protein COLO4_24416 [Corchorus olitorius]
MIKWLSTVNTLDRACPPPACISNVLMFVQVEESRKLCGILKWEGGKGETFEFQRLDNAWTWRFRGVSAVVQIGKGRRSRKKKGEASRRKEEKRLIKRVPNGQNSAVSGKGFYDLRF